MSVVVSQLEHRLLQSLDENGPIPARELAARLDQRGEWRVVTYSWPSHIEQTVVSGLSEALARLLAHANERGDICLRIESRAWPCVDWAIERGHGGNSRPELMLYARPERANER